MANSNETPPPDLTLCISKPDNQFVAAGAFGDVYKCGYTHGSTSEEVAVKAFRFRVTTDGDTADSVRHEKMLRRELGIWLRLDHTNVVPFLGIAYGFGMKGTMSLVSLWMSNGSLHDFLTKHNTCLSMAHRLQILLDIANGLQYLHSFPIVHGDLNCNNVLLDTSCTARLADFGYASLMGTIPEALAYLHRSTTRPGALRWSAPEHFEPKGLPSNIAKSDIESKGLPSKTVKSDIYSFGCICLQTLSGKQPWSEYPDDITVLLCLATNQRPGRPDTQTMSDSHWNFIQDCWSPMEGRPSMEVIVSTIKLFLNNCPLSQPLCDMLILRSSCPDSLVDDTLTLVQTTADGSSEDNTRSAATNSQQSSVDQLSTPPSSQTKDPPQKVLELFQMTKKPSEIRSFMNSSLNIILFGETGVGKSSVVNLIADQEVARFSPGVTGHTMSFEPYTFTVNGRNFHLWDTVGLEEPEMGVNEYLPTIEQTYQLIQQLTSRGGVDLLLFCIFGNRVTATTQNNYRLFYEVLCGSRVPIALVITHLEWEPDMEKWWGRNVHTLERFGINAASHACVTGLPTHSKYPEARRTIARLLEGYNGDARFTMPPEGWLMEFLRMFGLFSPLPLKKGTKRKDIMKVLTTRCKLDRKVAEELADKLEGRP